MGEKITDSEGTVVELQAQRPPQLSALDTLRSLSATNRIKTMRKNLENEKYIFDEMALSGQMTIFYSQPNVGKTLLFIRFIIDAIAAGIVKASSVFYINTDDNYKGLLSKSEIAVDSGFLMLSPDESGTDSKEIIELLVQMADEGDGIGKVIILDTLKKFTSMMSKTEQALLYRSLRRLTTKGATVIIAGHANKHLTENGKLIYEGTGDTKSDVDCMFSIYPLSEDDGEFAIEFRNEKSRGDVAARVAYTYLKQPGMSYRAILGSIEKLNDADAVRVRADGRHSILHKQYESEILFLGEALRNGALNQSQLLLVFKDSSHDIKAEFTRASFVRSLKALSGSVLDVKRGDNNAKFFSLLKNVPENSATSYRKAKDGI